MTEARDDPLKRGLLQTRRKEELYNTLASMVSDLHANGITSRDVSHLVDKESLHTEEGGVQDNEALNVLRKEIERQPISEEAARTGNR